MVQKILFQIVFASAVIGWYVLANQFGWIHENHTVIDAEYAMENCSTYYKAKDKKVAE